LALCGVSGYRLYARNNSDRNLKEAIDADEKAIALATRFGYTLPNAYKSLASALKTLIDDTPKKNKRRHYESRLDALKRSASKAKEKMERGRVNNNRNRTVVEEPEPRENWGNY
jgi:translation initiation factor 2B subunit (eIF-2B alpha/beta/delta family)